MIPYSVLIIRVIAVCWKRMASERFIKNDVTRVEEGSGCLVPTVTSMSTWGITHEDSFT
jgi:hypothetical protein